MYSRFRSVGPIRGMLTRVERKGRVYWYGIYRVGSDVKKTFIGEETPDLLARFHRYRELKAKAEPRAIERARLVHILRAERFMGLDATTSSLRATMSAAGVFRLGGTMVRTHLRKLPFET
jgi:hypothetical protein